MTMLWPRRTTTSREAGLADHQQTGYRTTRTAAPPSAPPAPPAPPSAPSAVTAYTMASPASVREARQRVEQLVEGLLPDGVDEGTGAALDRLIASWTAGWLAGIDAEHADHTAAIDRLIGTAREQVADARAEHEHRVLRLQIARQEQTDARARLGGTELRP